MKNVLIFFLLLTLAAYPAHAAFVIKKTMPAVEQTDNSIAEQPVKKDNKTIWVPRLSKTIASTFIHPKPRYRQGGRQGDGWPGIVSFLSSIGSLALLILMWSPLVATAAMALPALAILLAVLGVVFGAIGLNKDNRGLAIAGLVLGAILLLPAIISAIAFSLMVH